MKKLYTLFLLSLASFCLQAQTEIPGIYWINGHYFIYDSKLIIETSQCFPSTIEIEFDQIDDYTFERDGIVIESFTNTSGLVLNEWLLTPGFNYQIKGTNQGLICDVEIQTFFVELDSIDLNHNSITGDTLIICKDFSPKELSAIYKLSYFGDIITVGHSSCFESDEYMSIYINGEKQDEKKLHDLNLTTGDTLQIKRSQGTLYCPCDADQYETELSTKEYVIKVIDNPKAAITEILNGDTLICPGDTVWAGQTTATTKDFRWYKDKQYHSRSDTFAITTPGAYRMIEYNAASGTCPAVSEVYNVVKGENCKGFVNGYVRESGSYNNATGSYTTLPGVSLKTNSGLVTVSDSNGYYEFRYDSAMDFTRVTVADKNYYAGYQNVFTDNNFMQDLNTHIYTYLLEQNDLSITLASGRNRPGFTIPYSVSVQNRSKNEQTTNVTLVLDNALSYKTEEGEDVPASVNGRTLTWENITVASGETKRLRFYAQLERTTTLGTILNSSAALSLSDDVAENNTDTLVSEVTGSYDPNDKLVSFTGFASQGYVHDTTLFEYTVRFQNTGTDTAFTVRIEDVIDKDFDLSTISVIDASHNYRMTIDNDTVNWIFKNILLPDSTTNEPASHGFVRFSIEQKPNNPDGTILSNQASIFFDFNDPIITNEVVNEVGEPEIVATVNHKVQSVEVYAYPNPTQGELNFSGDGSVVIYSVRGEIQHSGSSQDINVSDWSDGMYYYEFRTKGTAQRGSFLKQ